MDVRSDRSGTRVVVECEPMTTRSDLTRVLSWCAPVLACSWIVRFEFLSILPSYAYSWDISSWERVARMLGTGENPYASTTFLNWPPLWMLAIFAMARIAEATGLEFITVLRIVLIGFESLLIVLTGVLIERLAPGARLRTILLFGMALNPVCILVICQHGNFDVIATTFVMAGLIALIAHGQSRDTADWLLACMFFGLAVLTKTFPVALTALLVPGARAESWKARSLGAMCLLGPTALGIGVLYVLTPDAIARNVLHYRSRPGTFGLSGLAEWFDVQFVEQVVRLSGSMLAPLIAAGVVAAWWWVKPDPKRVILAAALILLAIPTLGPGFGPQYAAWFVAPLVAVYPAVSGRMRLALQVAWAVSALTYFILYGYASDLGQFMTFLSGSPREIAFSRFATEFAGQTLISLPMFLSWVGLLVVGIVEFRGSRDGESEVAGA